MQKNEFFIPQIKIKYKIFVQVHVNQNPLHEDLCNYCKFMQQGEFTITLSNITVDAYNSNKHMNT